MTKHDCIAAADSLALVAMDSGDSTSNPGFMDGIGTAFQAWDFQGLDSMANWFELFGFTLALASFIFALLIKSEVSSIRNSFLLDKRLTSHIAALKGHAAEMNLLLPDFYPNRRQISAKLYTICSELLDFSKKIGWLARLKVHCLIWRIRWHNSRPMKDVSRETPPFLMFFTRPVRRIFTTTHNDIYVIWAQIHEVVNDMESLKKNRSKSLKA